VSRFIYCNAKCHYAEFMFSDVMLNVLILSVIMLSIIMLSDVMLNILMLSIMAPFHGDFIFQIDDITTGFLYYQSELVSMLFNIFSHHH